MGTKVPSLPMPPVEEEKLAGEKEEGKRMGAALGGAFGVSLDFPVLFVWFWCQPIREPLACNNTSKEKRS